MCTQHVLYVGPMCMCTSMSYMWDLCVCMPSMTYMWDLYVGPICGTYIWDLCVLTKTREKKGVLIQLSFKNVFSLIVVLVIVVVVCSVLCGERFVQSVWVSAHGAGCFSRCLDIFICARNANEVLALGGNAGWFVANATFFLSSFNSRVNGITAEDG